MIKASINGATAVKPMYAICPVTGSIGVSDVTFMQYPVIREPGTHLPSARTVQTVSRVCPKGWPILSSAKEATLDPDAKVCGGREVPARILNKL